MHRFTQRSTVTHSGAHRADEDTLNKWPNLQFVKSNESQD